MHEKTCDSIWDALSAYADGAASPAEVEQVERHVVDCPTCARDLAFMRHTTLSLGNVPEVMPPAYLREAILAATIHRVPWYRRVFAGAPARGLAMAGALAAVLGIVLMSRSPSTLPADIVGPMAKGPVVALNRPKPPLTAKSVPDNGWHRAPQAGQQLQLSPKTPGENEPRIHFPVLRIPLDSAPRAQFASATTKPPAMRVGPAKKAGAKTGIKPKAADSAAPMPDDMPEDDYLPSDGGTKPDSPSGSPMIADAKGADMGPMTNPSAVPNPGPAVAPAKTRITLVASGDSMSPSQVASLADLRKTVKRPADSVFNPSVFHSLDRRELRIDIYKSHF